MYSAFGSGLVLVPCEEVIIVIITSPLRQKLRSIIPGSPIRVMKAPANLDPDPRFVSWSRSWLTFPIPFSKEWDGVSFSSGFKLCQSSRTGFSSSESWGFRAPVFRIKV